MIVVGHPESTRRGLCRCCKRFVREHDSFRRPRRPARGNDDCIARLDWLAIAPHLVDQRLFGTRRKPLIDRERSIPGIPDSLQSLDELGTAGQVNRNEFRHDSRLDGVDRGDDLRRPLDLLGDRKTSKIGEAIAQHLHTDRQAGRHPERDDHSGDSQEVAR